MGQSIENKVKNRIFGHGKGWCFTIRDFNDLGSHDALKVSIFRLKEQGIICRVTSGVYYYQENHPILGDIPPDLKLIAKALARKYEMKIQPSGAYAANLLGLSEQVPAMLVFLTDGASKKIKVGNREIVFKKTTLKKMKMAGKISGLVVQALHYLGPEHIDEKQIRIIKSKLTDDDKKILLKDASFAPLWIKKIIIEKILEGVHG